MVKNKLLHCTNGFTLAEVLITLVIIGVIAAMTIPNLVNKTNNEELRTGLLKGQTTIANALELYYSKNGFKILPEKENETGNARIYYRIKPYFSLAKDAGMRDIIGMTTEYYKTFNNSRYIDSHMIDDGQLILNNGMTLFIENSGDSSTAYFAIDVNGYQKKPNRVGYDLFFFQLNDEGYIVPMGAEGTDYYSASNEYCSVSSSSQYNGFGCTAKALSDADYFKKLK